MEWTKVKSRGGRRRAGLGRKMNVNLSCGHHSGDVCEAGGNIGPELRK